MIQWLFFFLKEHEVLLAAVLLGGPLSLVLENIPDVLADTYFGACSSQRISEAFEQGLLR